MDSCPAREWEDTRGYADMKKVLLLILLIQSTSALAYTRNGAEFADYDNGNGSYGIGYKCDKGNIVIVKHNKGTIEVVHLKSGYSLGLYSKNQIKQQGYTIETFIKIACEEE